MIRHRDCREGCPLVESIERPQRQAPCARIREHLSTLFDTKRNEIYCFLFPGQPIRNARGARHPHIVWRLCETPIAKGVASDTDGLQTNSPDVRSSSVHAVYFDQRDADSAALAGENRCVLAGHERRVDARFLVVG